MPLKTIVAMLAMFVVAVLFSAGPALAQYKVYWGDVHGHTSLSDGKGSLDDYFTYARDVAKLDFVIVTDHDFGNGKPSWKMTKENWQLTQEKADQYTVDGKFIAIAGYEWTSQPKYWTSEEHLFDGPTKYYNHKNVYFPSRVDYIFSAKDPDYNSPNLLAAEVRKHGGLIHNNHLDSSPAGKDQFAYDPTNSTVIVNTEMSPDTIHHDGKVYRINCEKMLREYLNKGGKTGFVASTDTHEGKTAAKTAVLAQELTRPAIFEALGHRRNYAVFNARIMLDFKINGHFMGEEITIEGKPKIQAEVQGTDKIKEVVVVRDGAPIHTINPGTKNVRFDYEDDSFGNKSYYYLRVIQVDEGAPGNSSCAWSSPIWVTRTH
jgi:hypothetical protein